eukprot:356698-Prymnesium_polylepis.1
MRARGDRTCRAAPVRLAQAHGRREVGRARQLIRYAELSAVAARAVTVAVVQRDAAVLELRDYAGRCEPSDRARRAPRRDCAGEQEEDVALGRQHYSEPRPTLSTESTKWTVGHVAACGEPG